MDQTVQKVHTCWSNSNLPVAGGGGRADSNCRLVCSEVSRRNEIGLLVGKYANIVLRFDDSYGFVWHGVLACSMRPVCQKGSSTSSARGLPSPRFRLQLGSGV